MRKAAAVMAVFLLMAAVGASNVSAGAVRVQGAIWEDGDLYDTVATPTGFVSPPEHSTDPLYSFMLSGLGGQRSIAGSAPGDPDFNGGRWDVSIVVFTPAGIEAHDPDGDGIVNFEMTSDEELFEHLALGHLEIYEANFYFECPMLPRRH